MSSALVVASAALGCVLLGSIGAAQWLVLRGQGGEEIVFAMLPAERGVRVRASTLLFDQVVDRFLSTLPLPAACACRMERT